MQPVIISGENILSCLIRTASHRQKENRRLFIIISEFREPSSDFNEGHKICLNYKGDIMGASITHIYTLCRHE